ncbi:hypothetical protein G6L37_06185 [Agrobacterium rubi]|nr:hypothetical protein [Agrobacterium rubi]NTF24950.1 hypothetical protein [Agrobacterium rubi]
MTHFAVLVVLPEPPTKESITKALAPWHEFNGSDYDQPYVVEEDVTAQALDSAEKSTTTRVRDSDGTVHDPWDDQGELKSQFSRYDDERERAFFHVPQGFEELKLTLAEAGIDIPGWIAEEYGIAVLRQGEAADCLDVHKYGWVSVDDDGKIVNVTKRTNPNGKWDYWTLGGRYAGRLKPGYDPEKDPANQETCYLCDGTGKRDDQIGRDLRLKDPTYTCNSCRGAGMCAKWPSKWVDVGNTARWGDLDFPALRISSVAKRRAWVDEMRVGAGLTSEEFEIGHAARKAAHIVWQSLPERPLGAEYSDWLRSTQPDGDVAAKVRIADTWGDIDAPQGVKVYDWIEDAPPLSAYAVVIDGKWCAKGEVGWFGVSLGEQDDWPSQFEAILSSIPPDHYVAFVDCHT